MQVTRSPYVRCFGCRHWTSRESAVEVGGLLYGPECAARARESCVYWCTLCGAMFSEEGMFSMDVCRLCEAGL